MTDDLKEYYEERAGILEYCAGMTRERAEELACAEIETRKAQREAVDSGKVAK